MTEQRRILPRSSDINLSDIMRREGIRNIWRDPLLDRFSVTLLDYSSGQGGSVGEALEQAKRESARWAA